MNDKFQDRIPFNKPFIAGKELYNIAQAVINGHLAGDGPLGSVHGKTRERGSVSCP